jgi:hypothetical protein
VTRIQPAPAHPAWPAPVVAAPKAKEPGVRLPIATTQKATAIPGDRASLARELQRELRRVGCYDGEINGMWTPSTRRAMKTFTDRANATLPIEQPDYVLLSLVQAHPTKACGAGCPTGQGLTEDGRCVPSAILAQESRKTVPHSASSAPQPTTPAIASWSPVTATPQPSDTRTALAGVQDPLDGDAARSSLGANVAGDEIAPGALPPLAPSVGAPAGPPPIAAPRRPRGEWSRAFLHRNYSPN